MLAALLSGLAGVLAILIALAVLIFIYYLIAKAYLARFDRRRDRYVGYHLDSWHARLDVHSTSVRTIGGFNASCTFHNSLIRIDNTAFRAARMLDMDMVTKTLDVFRERYLLHILYPNSPYFLMYFWYANGDPAIVVQYFDFTNNGCDVAFDPNGNRLLSSIRSRCDSDTQSDHHNYNGCAFRVTCFDKQIDYESVLGNYNMLTPEEITKATSSIEYLRFKEAAVIAALKLRLDLLQTTKTEDGRNYSIEYAVVGQTVTLTWKLSDDVLRKRHRLLGFRREGGYSKEEKWDNSATDNGEPIIDSLANSSNVDRPTPGRSHYYTFYLVEPGLDGSLRRYDMIRIPVHVPQHGDIAPMIAELQSTRSARLAADVREQHGHPIVAKIDADMEIEQALIQYERTKTGQINKLNIEQSDKEHLVDELKHKIHDARSLFGIK